MAVLMIRAYQLSLGRLLPQRCRFHPTCSQYAVEAITERGLLRGGAAAAWRLVRCGPWTAGGIDPVRRSGRAVEAGNG
jgi:putative membrane protein insertion efficiency factor